MAAASGLSEERWRECAAFLTRVGLLSADHRANWPKATARDLAYTLRDGVQLCRLLNLIQPNSLEIKDINQRPQMAQFLCLRNIRTFLQACKTHFELKDSDLFPPSILFDLSDFGQVLRTLSILSTCPKAKRNGIVGFCAISPEDDGDGLPNLTEDMSLEDLGSEPTTPCILLPPLHRDAEESIYEELCYITFRIKQPNLRLTNLGLIFKTAAKNANIELAKYCGLLLVNPAFNNRPPVTLREKRDYVKGELLETETNYIEALQMLKKKFMRPLELSNLMKEDDRKIIFFGIKELNDIHNAFLSDLTRVLTAPTSTVATSSFSQTKTLGDVFTHWKDKFVIYGDYCANLTRAQSLTEELCAKNDGLNQEILKCEKETNGGRFKLRDLLSVPMQRVLKYHLLLQKLLDETSVELHGYDELQSVEKAHSAMSDIAEFTNEVKRDSETLSIIRQIEGSIYDLKMPDGMELKDYGRLQKDGELRIRGHDDNRLKSRYVFVFDKVMLMCKCTRMMDKILRVEQYSYKHSLCLQEYRVEDTPSGTIKKSGRDSRWSFGWNLVHHKEKNVYTMYASTEDQKRRWIKAIEDALNNIQPEESRLTDHVMVMQTVDRGVNCSHCKRFMKGLFYQGYKCVRCESQVHRECITQLRKCGTVQAQPPELPPRPLLLLPIPSLSESTAVSPTSSFRADPSPSPLGNGRLPLNPGAPVSPPLPLNNLNSPSTANGMRVSYPSHHYVNLSHLESFSWFAGEMERDMAQTILSEQPNGTFLVRVRPLQMTGRGSIQSVSSLISAADAAYALSLKWNEQVKHMKILITSDEKLFFLSESRYFKSVVELVDWYQHNSLAESFSGLDACLQLPYERTGNTPTGIVQFDYSGTGSEPSHAAFPMPRCPLTPS